MCSGFVFPCHSSSVMLPSAGLSWSLRNHTGPRNSSIHTFLHFNNFVVTRMC
uniref:Uncharacterized protein n=1 Tax=Anguilla anguilla TaxID=7936 RepID=A0A0E9QC45_ANGAN